MTPVSRREKTRALIPPTSSTENCTEFIEIATYVLYIALFTDIVDFFMITIIPYYICKYKFGCAIACSSGKSNNSICRYHNNLDIEYLIEHEGLIALWKHTNFVNIALTLSHEQDSPGAGSIYSTEKVENV